MLAKDENTYKITENRNVKHQKAIVRFVLSPPKGDLYRTSGLERPVLGRELSGDIAARGCRATGYRSRGLERLVLERELSGDIAAEGYRSTGLEKPVLEIELPGNIAAGG